MSVVITPDDQPVEIEPGRGDLRRSSIPFDEFLQNGPFWKGRTVSYARIFQTQPWVAIAVMRLLTWSVRVPLKVYRRIDDDEAQRLRPEDHPLAAAVAQPWERACSAELSTNIFGPLWVHGNSLVDVDEGRSGKIRFEPLDWRYAQPIRLDESDPNAEIEGWKYRQGKVETNRSVDTVMHLKWWSPLGQLGISPLEQIRVTIMSDDAATRWALNGLAQGIRPSGVVHADPQSAEKFLGISPQERQQLLEQLKSDMDEIYAGPEGRKVPVLPPGLTWSDAKQTTAVEAALIEQRLVNRTETAAIYMLQPGVIGQMEKSNYSNLVAQYQQSYTDSLAPPLIFGEQKINAHLVKGLLREDDIFVQYDFGHILRGDRLKEIQALREAIGSALMTPNEGREVLKLKKSEAEGAEKLWLAQNNLVPLDERPQSRPTQKAPAASAKEDE